ncbi:MAG: hypothetical protein AB1664_06025 [Thermodesulfobacteriota bacterium]
MARRKVLISAAELVDRIRSGASDETLMGQYGISAQRLERLLQKLVRAGKIAQAELDARLLASQRSHIVELTPRAPSAVPAVIDPDDAVRSIRQGLTDSALMQKYNLSARGVDSLFRKLLDSGYISEVELDARKHSLGWAELAFGNDQSGPDKEFEPDDETLAPQEGWFRALVARYKTAFAAVAGAVFGALVIVAVAFVADDFIFSMQRRVHRVPGSAQRQHDTVAVKVEDLILILDAIRAEAAGETLRSAVPDASEYRRCMKACQDDYDRAEDSDQAMLVDCRKACIARYSDSIRKIREQYYDPAGPRTKKR